MPVFQSFRADCGPAAVVNCLEALGIRRSLDEVTQLCRTTADGTSPLQIRRALSTLREPCELAGPMELRDTRPDIALLRISAVLADGRPLVALVDQFQHWVGVVGRLGHRFIVADSADLRQVIHYTPEEFSARWGYPGVRNGFYALGL